MNRITKLFVVVLFCLTSVAQAGTNYDSLIARVHKKIKAQKNLTIKNTKVLNIFISPEHPTVSDKVTIFMQPLTSFSANEISIIGALDGAPAAISNPAGDMFVFQAGTLSEVKSHQFSATVYLTNTADATQIRNSVKNIDAQIVVINNKIANSNNPTVIANLIAQRTALQAQENDLLASLAALKTQFAAETFSFDVLANNAAPGYPVITSVTPQVVSTNGGSPVTITGQNFTNLTELRLGGVLVTPTSASATSLVANVPALNVGAQTVEVKTTTSGVIKNTILKNAFYASSQPLANPDTLPTAVASATQGEVAFGVAAQVNANASFDSRALPLNYAWSFAKVPQGATEVVGATVGTNSNFSFTASAPGYYLLQAVVTQAVAPSLSSSPALVAIKVDEPTNHAPTATASSITASVNGSATTQVVVSDVDTWQNFSYFIKNQPALGTATVSPSGLVTYTAGAATGNDTVQIFVVDSGTPALGYTLSVPVSIIAGQPPVIGTILPLLTSQGAPISVLFLPIGGTYSPNGPIVSWQYDFGDGTSELASASTGGLIFHNYMHAGMYTAHLTIMDNIGATATQAFSVNVLDTFISQAKFSVDHLSGNLPLTVNFNAASTAITPGATILDYGWNWNDGTPGQDSTNTTASHTFTQAGVYPVTLTTVDSNLGFNQTTVMIYAGTSMPATGSPSVAKITEIPRLITVGHSVAFDASNSFDPNNAAITGYNWNFGDFISCGDGCTGSGINTSYSYPQIGNYYPYVSLTNSLGGAVGPVFIGEVLAVATGAPPKSVMLFNGQPIPVFGLAPVTAPYTVTLDGSKSYDYDGGTITGYAINFGDGSSTVNAATATHTYSTPGVYFPSLTVVDNDNNTYKQTVALTVNSAKLEQKVSMNTTPPQFPNIPANTQQKQMLTNACAGGAAPACYQLAQMYQHDGDAFTAHALFQKSCTMGYQPACSAGE